MTAWFEQPPSINLGAVVRAMDAAYREVLPRLPLSISDAAEVLGVSAHTLRWYESEGLLRVPRTASGYRSFDGDALQRAVLVTRMRSSGMPLATLRRYVDLIDQGDATVAERRAILAAHRQDLVRQLTDLTTALAVTEYKLAAYDAPDPRDTASGDDS